MQTILGANGQIAQELARELGRNYPGPLRLVSRRPQKVHATDELVAADLLDPEAAARATAGSETAYLTVGLPIDSTRWEQQFPVIMRNVLEACRTHRCRLVFFDNTYMYAKTAVPQTEESPFVPQGRKSVVRAQIATMLRDEMRTGALTAAIGRAPEFYGPGKTQSLTNRLVFDRIRRGQKPKVPLRDDVRRTLIWTPDASRALARIGNTPDAFGQTWHLPCDDARPTYRELIQLASEAGGKDLGYSILRKWMFRLGGLVNKDLAEVAELLPRYERDNVFVSDKFKARFPDFRVTTYREGVRRLLAEPGAEG